MCRDGHPECCSSHGCPGPLLGLLHPLSGLPGAQVQSLRTLKAARGDAGWVSTLFCFDRLSPSCLWKNCWESKAHSMSVAKCFPPFALLKAWGLSHSLKMHVPFAMVWMPRRLKCQGNQAGSRRVGPLGQGLGDGWLSRALVNCLEDSVHAKRTPCSTANRHCRCCCFSELEREGVESTDDVSVGAA